MRDIWSYPVSFPYGATSPPYSTTHRHMGEDRAAPKGTPITVNGIVIGLVGTTGKSTGNHLHVQKVAGGVVRPPHGGGATMPNPEVYETGTRADIGNYVRIKDANGVQWSYFHMSAIKVGKGPLKGEEMTNAGDITNIYQVLLGRDPDPSGLSHYTGKSWNAVFYSIKDSAEYKNRQNNLANLQKQITDQQKIIDAQTKQLADLAKQVDELSKRPTQSDLDKLQASYDSLAKDYAALVKKAEETPPSVPKPEIKPQPQPKNWLVDFFDKLFARRR